MIHRFRMLAWGLSAGVVLSSCQSASKPQPEPAQEQRMKRALPQGTNLQKIYLEEMPQALALPAGENTALRVAGNLPSGAYKYDHTQVEVKGRTIEITPWAQYDPNVMAIQMLIPFVDSVAVGPLAPGEYQVRFHARSGTHTAKLEVK